MTLPIVLNKSGRVNKSPQELRDELTAMVAADIPGYTSTLPGSLISDIAGTDTAATVICDQFVTELINSVTPYGANQFILNQLGQIYGVQPGQTTNTSVYVVFSSPNTGFVVTQGFTVSDGTYSYIAQSSVIINAGGTSEPVYCLATQTGSWAVPPNTVVNISTSLPSGITLTVTNPVAGIPQQAEETIDQYREAVLISGMAAASDWPTTIKTALRNVAGVQQRLVSLVANYNTATYQIICGGGDQYAIADAIYNTTFDFTTLVGSTISVTNITQANPGVVTTDITHGLTTGQTGVEINGVVGMTAINDVPLTVTVLTPYTFSVGIDTSGFAAYISGGVVTPNSRNLSVSINNVPDTYLINYINPLQQIVGINVLWNTSSNNFVSPVAVSQLSIPALIDYINGIYAGQPINLFNMQEIFQLSIASVIPASQLTRMVFSITIDGISVSPSAGTGIIQGDPYSYLYTTSANITVTQG
jgi:hypothetical protein